MEVRQSLHGGKIWGLQQITRKPRGSESTLRLMGVLEKVKGRGKGKITFLS